MTLGGKTQLMTHYSFALYTCHTYWQVLDVARTAYMVAPDWLKVERQDFWCFPTWAYLASKAKCLVEWEKIACMSRTIISEVESYELGCFYRTKTCFVAFIVDPSRVKLPLTRTTQGIYACLAYQKIKGARCTYRKVFKLLPEKPHKWWRFSIFASGMIICPPH